MRNHAKPKDTLCMLSQYFAFMIGSHFSLRRRDVILSSRKLWTESSRCCFKATH